MNSQTFALAAALVAIVAAMPADVMPAPKLDLATVMNRTVCPVKIEIDVDENRVPKKIKVIKCDEEPNKWCSRMHIPKHECCQHRHDHVNLQCVEVQDTVQVYYPQHALSQPYRVSVGCACMLQLMGDVEDAVPGR